MGGDFDCSKNKLKTLQGGPREVGGKYWCHSNKLLKSLEGIGNVSGEIEADRRLKQLK